MEKFLFYASDDDELHNSKQEFLTQLSQFDIVVDAMGFFDIDRRFIAAVSSLYLLFKV